MTSTNRPPTNAAIWSDTWIESLESEKTRSYLNVLGNENMNVSRRDEKYIINAADLFACFPVALLLIYVDE